MDRKRCSQDLNTAIIKNGKLTNETIVESGWSSKDLYLEYITNNMQPITDNKGQETTFVITLTGAIEVIKKRKELQSHVISVLAGLGNTQSNSARLKKLGVFFDYPKPVSLIKYLVSMNEGENFTVLDFFGGSATTAEAVMLLNNEDNGNRKFIIVQLPEKCAVESEAKKAGFMNIADVAKERIRKNIEEIINERSKKFAFEKNKQDFGFKVFKLKPSNFKLWRGDVIANGEQLMKQMDIFVDPTKPDASQVNMLYELLLKSGRDLNSKIEKRDCNTFDYYAVADGALVIILSGINEALIKEVIVQKPQKVLCLDKLFADNDQLKTNTVLQMKDADIDFRTI